MSAPVEFQHDVFIFYSSADADWVRGELLKRIEDAGLRAFIDFRDFRPGAANIKEMERGVTTCRKTLVVLTPSYLDSEWCEIESVMSQTQDLTKREPRLIPLLKSRCEKPLRIGVLTHVDFTDDADRDLAWRRLLTALDATAQQPAANAIPTEIQTELDRAKEFSDADRFAEAIPILQQALTAADDFGHGVARVKVRVALAFALYEAREDFTSAEQHFRDALALVPVDDLELRHNVLHGLGDMLIFSGRLEEAQAVVDTGLRVARLTGKTDDVAGSLLSRSLLKRALGLHTDAVAGIDEAVNLLLRRDLTPPEADKKTYAHMLAVSYINKAQLCRDAGDLDEAVAIYAKVEEQHRVSGDKLNAGKAHLFCGEVHCANADWQQALESFRLALELFQEVRNPLWGARVPEHLARLFATHERWKDAVQAIAGTVAGAEESGHPGDQVEFLCSEAGLVREWKTQAARRSAADRLHALSKTEPEDTLADVMAEASAKMGEVSDAIDKAVREDQEVRGLLGQAKQVAENAHLPEHLANCLLAEADEFVQEDDTRRGLTVRAIGLLREALRRAQAPKRRGHLMGRISALHRKLGDSAESMSWLRRAGEVFETSGDVFGLANFYGSLAELHRADGRLDDEIEAYRKVLTLVEGRSFNHLAAGTRINLAAALRYRQAFTDAQKLLDEAEAISDRHHFSDFVGAIARNRSAIETDMAATQVPAHTLRELLNNFGQLLAYKPEHAVAYLAFWYFAWKTELLALLRSGPNLSLMVVTDDVGRFLRFAGRFAHLVDHFLMAGSGAPAIKAEPGVLAIPPDWLFPRSFPFIFARRNVPAEAPKGREEHDRAADDEPPSVHLAGPARRAAPSRARWCGTSRVPSCGVSDPRGRVRGQGWGPKGGVAHAMASL